MVGYTVISRLDVGTRRVGYLARDAKGKDIVLIQPDIKKIRLQHLAIDGRAGGPLGGEKEVQKIINLEKEKFKSDFEKMKGLTHPRVAEVHNVVFDSDNDNYVAILEYAPGENIFAASRGLTWIQKTALIAQVLDGLQFIHNNGFLHLNVKSRYVHVELTKLQAKLTDFGYAFEKKAKYDGRLRGSAHSVAPEIVLGNNDKVGVKSDIYSAGILWYYILTGKFPFPDRDRARTNQALLPDIVKKEGRPTEVFYSDPTIPEECNQILLKMIDSEPGKRYKTAEQVKSLLIETWPEISEDNLDRTLSTMRVLSAEPSIEEADDEL
jgi:serine/threonine protein kinase